MKVSLTPILALSLALTSIADATTFNLFHRITSPSVSGEWSLRATLNLDSCSLSNTSVMLNNQLSSEEVEKLKKAAYEDVAGERYYQVSLVPSSSSTKSVGVGEKGLMTSLKLCHLRQSHPDLPSLEDELLLTLRSPQIPSTPNADVVVTGISYRILDITLSPPSFCPTLNPTKFNTIQSNLRKLRARRRGTPKTPDTPTPFQFNTKLVNKEMERVKAIVLKQAMPTNEDGTVKEAENEKTFLQKYWFYLIPIAVLLIMPPGDEEPAKTTAGGGARGQAAVKKE